MIPGLASVIQLIEEIEPERLILSGCDQCPENLEGTRPPGYRQSQGGLFRRPRLATGFGGRAIKKIDTETPASNGLSRKTFTCSPWSPKIRESEDGES
jgi:hypothetical protein